jgi:hypothetical protein
MFILYNVHCSDLNNDAVSVNCFRDQNHRGAAETVCLFYNV